MDSIDSVLGEVYVGQERVSQQEIYRRAVAADLPADVITALAALPEGEYTEDEVTEAVGATLPSATAPGTGVPAEALDDATLLRELAELHRTRHDTLRHGADQALAAHTSRTTELEGEYLRRFPEREVVPDRLRSGARERAGAS